LFKRKDDAIRMAIPDAIKAEVTSKLSSIPLIGPLADLINPVIGAFTPFADQLTGAFGVLINAVLSLLDLLNVSIPFTLLTFYKKQTFIPIITFPIGVRSNRGEKGSISSTIPHWEPKSSTRKPKETSRLKAKGRFRVMAACGQVMQNCGVQILPSQLRSTHARTGGMQRGGRI
jgi:hypothetical protein